MTERHWLPLPFPDCIQCDKAWEQCVHAECRGNVEVQPMTGRVRCESCSESWNIWESDFLCPCGARFAARQIEDTLSEMLDYCRRLVFELALVSDARARRSDLSKDSMRTFLTGMMNGLGRSVGVVVESVLRYFFPR